MVWSRSGVRSGESARFAIEPDSLNRAPLIPAYAGENRLNESGPAFHRPALVESVAVYGPAAREANATWGRPLPRRDAMTRPAAVMGSG
jgi:hypothetical protein